MTGSGTGLTASLMNKAHKVSNIALSTQHGKHSVILLLLKTSYRQAEFDPSLIVWDLNN